MGQSLEVRDANSASLTRRAGQDEIPLKHALGAASASENSMTAVPENNPVRASETCIYMKRGLPTVSIHSFFNCASVIVYGKFDTRIKLAGECAPGSRVASGGGPTRIRDTNE